QTVRPLVAAHAAVDAVTGVQVRELELRQVRAAAAATRAGEPPARGADPVRADGAARVLAMLEAERWAVAAHLQLPVGGLGRCRSRALRPLLVYSPASLGSETRLSKACGSRYSKSRIQVNWTGIQDAGGSSGSLGGLGRRWRLARRAGRRRPGEIARPDEY